MSALPNNCRYLPGTTCDRADCDRSAACPGPVDMSPTADQRGRDRREEEKPMASPTKATVGRCPECQRDDQTLRTSKHHEGRHCERCVAKFAYRAKAGSAGKAAKKPASAPKAASVQIATRPTEEPRSAVKLQQRAAQAAAMALPAATPQPPPSAGTRDITLQVISDIAARSAEGCRKYGTPLQAHNGRDALMDAYQEALDLCCYLRQAITEREPAVGAGRVSVARG